MSYGAPWEQGVGAANMMPLHDMEAPGLVPAVNGVGLGMKEAWCHCSQCVRQQQCWEEKSLQREQSVVDCDRCLDVIAGAADDHRQELKVIS